MARKYTRTWSCFGIILLSIVAAGGQFINTCQSQCSASQPSQPDSQCDSTCKEQSCQTGCTLWSNSTLLEGCHQSCANSFSNETFKVQYCERGCKFSEEQYVQAILNADERTAPELSSAPTSTAISIQWDGSSNSEVYYIVQWHYADRVPVTWTTFNSTRETDLTVTGLYPYTNYKFRVQWVVISPSYTEVTPESVTIQTMAEGPPLEAPVITTLVSPSPTSILVEWLPIFFSAGEIVGYELAIDSGAGIVRITVESDRRSYTFSGQQPSTLYNVSVSARNMAGTGPLNWKTITTQDVLTDNTTVPYLVYGVEHITEVTSQRVATVDILPIPFLSDTPFQHLHVLEDNSSRILDVAVHYSENYLFFIDETNSIYRKNIPDLAAAVSDNVTKQIVAGSSATKLTVDWLYDQIYFINNDTSHSIMRCSLDGSSQTTAVGSLSDVPLEIAVDPFNGYLFWSDTSGVQRLDLADVGSGAKDLAVTILSIPSLRAFVIDSAASEIFYPNTSENSIGRAQLDGSSRSTAKESSLDLQNMLALQRYDELFFWQQATPPLFSCTNTQIQAEGRLRFQVRNNDQLSDQEYFYYVCLHGFGGLDVLHPSSQPSPSPVVAPANLQVLFGVDTATLLWDPLRPLEGKGRGAYQRWSYQVNVESSGNDAMQYDVAEGITTFQVPGLASDTEYSITVRATSAAGQGPLSDPFIGRTFIDVTPPAYLLMATNSSLTRSAVDGSEPQNLVTLDYSVTDLTWGRGFAYWINGDGTELYALNLEEAGRAPSLVTGHESSLLRALAVDWIGLKMYWADSDMNQILRADITGTSLSNIESVQSFAPARDLVVDSVNGHLYWAEELRVEVARLNGQDMENIDSHNDFSNEAVAGLTLDYESEKIFWFVISSVDGNAELRLYSANLLKASSPSPTLVDIVDSSTMQATLHIYSNKLFWVNMDNRLSITDVTGGSLSIMTSDPISEVTVVESTTLQPFPAGFSEAPNVRPNIIRSELIVTEGTWNNFNVTWPASTEVQYGDVFYEVSIQGLDYSYSGIQQENYVSIDSVPPYHQLGVSIQAFTYWSSSEVATTTLRSPMSEPSVPLNARLFVEEDYDIITGVSSFTAVFRWDKEELTNGILSGYRVMWRTNQTAVFQVIEVEPDDFQFELALSDVSEDYTFQVAGYTEVGEGPATTPLTGSAQATNSPPSFMTQTATGGFTIVDSDTGEVIATGPENADAVVYHAPTGNWYYFEQGDLLLMEGDDVKRLITVMDTPVQEAFTLDWITMTLYWAIEDVVYLHDTARINDYRMIDNVDNGRIGQLVVSPLENFLIWSDDAGMLRPFDLKTSRISYVPSRERRQIDGNTRCNEMAADGAFGLDTAAVGSTRLYYYNAASQSIWVSECRGGNSTLLFNASTEAESALPATSMTVDETRLYWIKDSSLASILKDTGTDFRIETTDLTVLIASGSSLQPFPDPECLVPSDPVMPPSLINAVKDRLDLLLGEVSAPPSCGSVSLATPTYRVYYSNVTGPNEPFTEYEDTVELEVQLTQLEAYTNYHIYVEVTNIYTRNVTNMTSVSSDVIVHRTWVGVPSAPMNVTIEPLTPYELLVSWLPPLELNGPSSSLEYSLQVAPQLGTTFDTSVTLTDLSPSESVTTMVLVSHSNAKDVTQGRSAPATGMTFAEPGPLWLGEVTSYSIEVCWNTSEEIQTYRLLHQYYRSDIYNDPQGDILTGPEIPAERGKQCETIGSRSDELRPYSTYSIRQDSLFISDVWVTSEEIPEYQVLEVRTEGDVPDNVDPPTVSENKVTWEEPDPRGPGTLMYTLQAKRSVNSNKRALEDWGTVYMGDQTSWSINLTANEMYSFRVAAANDVGMGQFSPDSEPFMVEPEPPEGAGIGVIVGVAVGAVAIVILILIILFCCLRRKEDKNHNLGGPVSYQADNELATLRNYPTHMEGNQLYALTTTADGKDVKLPLFARERLKLMTFLGSGAFGEVFEGVALNILTPTSGKTKVAVKTLKKGSSDEEKEDFLKEAMLMSNFHHANIMGLLGVCLDNDPQYLILELMEGGDLLTYLRGARATQEADAKLTEADLVDIVTDVARGCKYLEEMHFVHRDLAARNCLVSCQGYEDAKCRITKIGDFGLARDIYKSDYYRKEGEGLLPVRWMAPEGLIDGLFTNASDIWAFGVLVWEVFTYGQQPYPARTNIEVLKFVTEGGRLDRPEICPDDMYSLMTKCWEKTARSRPSFLIILDRCELYRRKSFGPGYDNEAFLEDKINYSKVSQNLETDDYLEPMEKGEPDEIKKQKPPNLNIGDPPLTPPTEKKREGSFRRLMGAMGGGGDPPQSPQPMLEAAVKEQSWQKNRPSIDDRYLQMPVGRSASSVQPGSKPEGGGASVMRGESVNIPAHSSGGSDRKRRVPKSPLAAVGLAGMPERPAPGPPPTGAAGSRQKPAPPAPPQGGSSPANPFRQHDNGEGNNIKVEYYNV